MRRLVVLYRSIVGKKIIVAVTGVLMLGFLIGHVAGNLKVFLPDTPEGRPDIDEYAEFLKEIGEPLIPHAGALWVARLVLLASLILHVVCVIQLARLNRAARPIGYQQNRFARATESARWMMYTGLFLLVFVLFHLLHFTLGWIQPSRFEHGQVYENLQAAFNQFTWFAVYIVSIAILTLHLVHGTWSLFQTLGWDNPDRNRGLRRLAMGISVVLFVGFVAVPTAFFVGVLKPIDGEVVRSGDDTQIVIVNSRGLNAAKLEQED